MKSTVGYVVDHLKEINEKKSIVLFQGKRVRSIASEHGNEKPVRHTDNCVLFVLEGATVRNPSRRDSVDLLEDGSATFEIKMIV